MKWLWWVLILLGLIWLARGLRLQGRGSTRPSEAGQSPSDDRRDARGEPGARAAAAKAIGSREVVPCAYCGLHLPRDETIASPAGDEVFCSEAHRLALAERRRSQSGPP